MEIQTSIHTISICVVPKQNGAHEEGVGLQGSTGTLVGDAYVPEEIPAGGAIPIGTANRGYVHWEASGDRGYCHYF